MNARTSRLLARVAHLMFINDPHDPRQPEASVLKDMKEAWNNLPPDRRGVYRKGIVAAANQLIQGGKSV